MIELISYFDMSCFYQLIHWPGRLLFVRFQEEVQQLSDTEKLLLYLRLPGETASDSLEDFDQ